MTKFVAKRLNCARPTWSLLADGQEFALLRYTVGGWMVFDAFELDEELTYELRAFSCKEPEVALKDVLAVCRRGYENRDERWAAEHKAECEAETAWLRHAELPSYDDMGFEQWEANRLGYWQ